MSEFEPGLTKPEHIALEELFMKSLPGQIHFGAHEMTLVVQRKLEKLGYAEWNVHDLFVISESGKSAYMAWVESCQSGRAAMIVDAG